MLGKLGLMAFAIFTAVNFLSGAPSCPAPQSIQTDFVKQNFSVVKFQGVWYELAYHDITQLIGWCGCESSVKHYHADTNYIFDNITLHCLSGIYSNNVTYNLTGFVKGHMEGNWPLLPGIVFPNTVVAVGVNKTTGEYDWVIEFQCVEVAEQVLFTGIEFYNRDSVVPEAELQLMLDTARTQGLGYWMDTGLKVRIVDRHNCPHESVEEMVQEHIDHQYY